MATFGRSARWPEKENQAVGRAALKNPAPRQKPRPGGKLQDTSHVQPQRPALRQQNGPRVNKASKKHEDDTAKMPSPDLEPESTCEPKKTTESDGLPTRADSFSASLLLSGVPDIDCDDAGEPLLCSQYAKDIYHYMFSLEAKWPIRAGFLSSQVNVTASIRAHVIDWLIEVRTFFDLVPETLFLTVSLMDRYLQKHAIDKRKAQLLAISALFVASKFEEVEPPSLGDLAYVTDYHCKNREVLEMEKLILRAVDWSLGRPLPLHFLRRGCKAAEASSPEKKTAVFLLELSLLDYFMASVAPSKQAAAALYCALQLHGRPEDCWDEKMACYSGCSQESMQPFVQRMAKLMLDAPTSQNKTAYKKFVGRKQDDVAHLWNRTNAKKLRKMAGRIN